MGLSQDMGVVAPSRQGFGEQEDGASHRQGERLAGPQAGQDTSSPHHLKRIGDISGQRALGDGCDELVDQGWLGGGDGRHRLLHAQAGGRACVQERSRSGGGEGAGDGVFGGVWIDLCERRTACAAKRQRKGIHVEAIHGTMQTVWTQPGVHNTIHTAAERDVRAFLPLTQRGVHLAAQLRRLARREGSDLRMGGILQ